MAAVVIYFAWLALGCGLGGSPTWTDFPKPLKILGFAGVAEWQTRQT